MNERDQFFDTIRSALGRRNSQTPVHIPGDSRLAVDSTIIEARAEAIRSHMKTESGDLIEELSLSAARAGWNVARFKSIHEVGKYVATIAQDVEAKLVVRSTQDTLKDDVVEKWLNPLGIQVVPLTLEDRNATTRNDLRSIAERADIGITGVDYAIAETGTCVLIPSAQVSRLVSLLPPVHIAIVNRGEVLPSLDELFALRRKDFLDGKLGSHMNLISGPSRSADIEYTLVTGVHGPGQVHIALVG